MRDNTHVTAPGDYSTGYHLTTDLTDKAIEFMTGLAANPSCGGEDLVTIAVPTGTQLPAKPGCERSVPEAIRDWWRGIVR